MELKLTNDELELIKYYREEAFKKINQMLVTDSRTDIAILSDEQDDEKIVYDKDILKETYNAFDEDKVKEEIWNKVKEINKTMPAYKYIREIIVTQEELIKTTTQKVKRHEEIKKVL